MDNFCWNVFDHIPWKANHETAATNPADRNVSNEKKKTAARTGIQQQKCFDISCEKENRKLMCEEGTS